MLGFSVHKDGIQPLEKRVEDIVNLPVPEKLQAVTLIFGGDFLLHKMYYILQFYCPFLKCCIRQGPV